MSHQVQVPRHVLLAGVALGLLSLLGIAYLLGRQDAARHPLPVTPSSPTPALPELITAVTPAARSLDERLDALEQRIDSVKQRSGTPVVVASPTAAARAPIRLGSEIESRRAYFQRIDALLGRSALSGTQPLASRLLQRGMAGNAQQFDELLEQTKTIMLELGAVQPPEECREHHRLLLAQLAKASALLREVKAANASGHTERLDAVASQSLAQGGQEFITLQQLDRVLREGVDENPPAPEVP